MQKMSGLRLGRVASSRELSSRIHTSYMLQVRLTVRRCGRSKLTMILVSRHQCCFNDIRIAPAADCLMLVPGDCGSWVVSAQTGRLIGYVVARDSTLHRIHMVQMAELFHNMETVLGKAVTLPPSPFHSRFGGKNLPSVLASNE